MVHMMNERDMMADQEESQESAKSKMLEGLMGFLDDLENLALTGKAYRERLLAQGFSEPVAEGLAAQWIAGMQARIFHL